MLQPRITLPILAGIFVHILGGLAQDTTIRLEVSEQMAGTFGSVKSSPQVRAYFPNTSEQNQLRFALTPNPNQIGELFRIDEVTGQMSTTTSIDREEFCPSQETCYMFIDMIVRAPSFQSFTVQIEILDVNDDIPFFDPSELSLTFPEGAPAGTGRALPLAVDRDSPQHGVIRYELLNANNTFELELTGASSSFRGIRLILRGLLDREQQESYTLQLAAYDSNDRTRRGLLTIFISVEDINDHAPVFTQPSYTIHIPEDVAPIAHIGTVNATDADTGMNGRVVYSFSPMAVDQITGQFKIENTTGKLFVLSNLDYETEDVYRLEIVASDFGAEPKSSVTSVNIFVSDINDNAPEITISTFTSFSDVRIAENSPNHTFLAHIRVTDADKTGNNKRTACAQTDPAFLLEPFQNTVDQYNIYSNIVFNRELKARYTVSIECHDLGIPRMQSNRTLIVNVLDVNDNPPVVSRDLYEVSLVENNVVGALVLRINATDSDIGENANIRYTINSTDILNYLVINENTGEIKAKVRFDYESLTFIQFQVYISDAVNSSHVVSTRVILHIVDANDERPTFSQSQFVFSIPEGPVPSRLIGNVVATDADSTPFNRMTYSILRNDANLPFEIDPETGDIVSTETFNRENIDRYSFEVRVTDFENPAFFDSADVIVDIADINDNPPYFIYPNDHNNSISISNKVPTATAIFSVQAADNDIGNNANITYEITDTDINNRDRFRISPVWGTVVVNEDLSEIKYEEYIIRLSIHDNGTPMQFAARTFTIVIDSRISYESSTGSAQDDEGGGGNNMAIIGAVSAISVLLVLSLIGAIVFLKLREKRKPKHGGLDDTPYDAEQKEVAEFDGPFTLTDSIQHGSFPAEHLGVTSGSSSPLFSLDGPHTVSLAPSGDKKHSDQLKPVISTDKILLYDKNLPQKTYLSGSGGGGDHDTSSSTEDSGRGPSEEGADSRNRETQGATPEIIADSRLPSQKIQLHHTAYTIIPHTVYHSPYSDRSSRQAYPTQPGKPSSLVNMPIGQSSDVPAQDSQPPKPSSLVNQKTRADSPPSYDSFIRRKSSRRKKVNFIIDGVTVGESESDQLPNDMQYPMRGTQDDLSTSGRPKTDPLQFVSQPKPLRSSLKKTSSSNQPKYPLCVDNLAVIHPQTNLNPGGYLRASMKGVRSIDSDHSLSSVIV